MTLHVCGLSGYGLSAGEVDADPTVMDRRNLRRLSAASNLALLQK